MRRRNFGLTPHPAFSHPVRQRGEAAIKPGVIPRSEATRNLASPFLPTGAQSEIPRFARNDSPKKLARKARIYELAMQEEGLKVEVSNAFSSDRRHNLAMGDAVMRV